MITGGSVLKHRGVEVFRTAGGKLIKVRGVLNSRQSKEAGMESIIAESYQGNILYQPLRESVLRLSRINNIKVSAVFHNTYSIYSLDYAP